MTDEPARVESELRLYERRWWTLAVLCLSIVIIFVGNSSLNVAIPTLSRVLHATNSELQWVVAVYSLVFAGLLFSAGALGDRFGRKGALQAGLVLFLVAAALASESTVMWQLIACRALMGAAAAFIMPSTLSILINVFPPEERTKAIAIWASFTGAAGAIGPVGSGILLGHFWYGSIFLINVPIVALALISGRFLIPKSRDPEQARFDPLGALLSIVGIGAVVYALIEAPNSGWLATSTVAAFASGAVALALFVVWERRVADPMLDMTYFRNAAFSTGTSGMILLFLAMFGVIFLLTQYFQLVLGYSPLGAALRLLPMAPIMLIVAPLTPRLSARVGVNRTVASGMALIAVGFLLFHGLTVHTAYLYVLGCLVLLVGGISLAMAPMTASIMSAVPLRRAGAGSATNDATRELGAALGIAVLGSVAASRYGSSLGPVVGRLAASARSTARGSLAGALHVASGLAPAVRRALELGAKHAFVDGLRLSALFGAALAVAAAVIVIRYLPRVLAHQGAARGPIEAAEDAAELGLAGTLPVFADEPAAPSGARSGAASD
jgi:EmrB/QacA subfamily drug resistance transporter